MIDSSTRGRNRGLAKTQTLDTGTPALHVRVTGGDKLPRLAFGLLAGATVRINRYE